MFLFGCGGSNYPKGRFVGCASRKVCETFLLVFDGGRNSTMLVKIVAVAAFFLCVLGVSYSQGKSGSLKYFRRAAAKGRTILGVEMVTEPPLCERKPLK